MKIKIIWIALLAVSLLMGAACNKETTNINNLKKDLIGKWEWVESFQPGINWHVTAENTGLNELMTIDEDSCTIIRNNEVFLKGTYKINKESDKYFITIFSNKTFGADNSSHFTQEITLNKSKDTLGLSSSVSYGYFNIVYKKI